MNAENLVMKTLKATQEHSKPVSTYSLALKMGIPLQASDGHPLSRRKLNPRGNNMFYVTEHTERTGHTGRTAGRALRKWRRETARLYPGAVVELTRHIPSPYRAEPGAYVTYISGEEAWVHTHPEGATAYVDA